MNCLASLLACPGQPQQRALTGSISTRPQVLGRLACRLGMSCYSTTLPHTSSRNLQSLLRHQRRHRPLFENGMRHGCALRNTRRLYAQDSMEWHINRVKRSWMPLVLGHHQCALRLNCDLYAHACFSRLSIASVDLERSDHCRLLSSEKVATCVHGQRDGRSWSQVFTFVARHPCDAGTAAWTSSSRRLGNGRC
jgi:hypothetical protein